MNCVYRNILELYVDTNQREIYFGKCCVINESVHFGKLTFDDFYNLKDFWSFLKFKHQILPVGHNKKPPKHSFCANTDVCDWHDEPLKQIRVNINSCNLSCIMCHNDHHYDRESMEVYWHILNLVKGRNLEKLILTTGGEPFLQKNVAVDYICSLTKADCEVLEIITNGTLITTDDIIKISEATKRNGVTCRIQVSIDSTDKDTYCKIRNTTEKQFETVMNNVITLNNEGILSGINIVMMPENEHTIYDDCVYWNEQKIVFHILPVRYDNGVGAAKISDTIEKIKHDFPTSYGDA